MGYADPLSRSCISPCFSSATSYYFGDPSTKNCVLVCPEVPDYFGDNTTRTCVDNCTGSTVRDPQYMRRCVNIGSCSRTPVPLFGDLLKDLCVVALNCTDGYYGDNNTKQCRQTCAGPTLIYADNVTKQCVSVCELGWFGFNVSTGNGVCSQYCPTNQWADNLTVTCTTRCSASTYGVNHTGSWNTSGSSFLAYGVC